MGAWVHLQYRTIDNHHITDAVGDVAVCIRDGLMYRGAATDDTSEDGLKHFVFSSEIIMQ